MNNRLISCPVKLVCFLALAATLQAADPASEAPKSTAEPAKSGLQRWAEQDYMLGDWGGARSYLSKHGVDFEFFYAAEEPINLEGGLKRGAAYQGLLAMMLDLDSRKLLGYPGGRFHVSSLYIHGKEFSKNYVGDLNRVALLDVDRGLRLWELWYEQKVLDDKIALKAGQLVVDADFVYSEYAQNFTFINQTWRFPTLPFSLFDQPGVPQGRHGLPSTPFGAPGALLRVSPLDCFYVQAAVYDGDPDQGDSGTRIKLSSEEGALAFFETGYKLNQGKEDTGLPGTYRIGAYYHTDDFYDLRGAVLNQDPILSFVFGEPQRTHSGNYGWYFVADQMLYREKDKEDPAKQGLGAFFRVSGAPADRNLATFSVDGGLVYKGLIPGRDWDTLGVAGSYMEISKDIRHAQEDINALSPGATVPVDYEAFVELSYKAQLTAWWTIQPSIQYVMHPGGSKAIPNAVAFVLMSTLRF